MRYPGDQVLLLTLTAPGDSEHRLPSGKLCECTPAGGVELANWNAHGGERWNRFCQALRRAWGQQVQYFRATEVQRRGALHFHVMIRLQRGQVVALSELRALAIAHGFGHEVRCDPVRNGAAAGYVAKYCSKASGVRASVPWRAIHRSTGEVRCRAAYRTWSSSRRWGQTMRQVLEEQRVWAIAAAASPEGAQALAPKAPLDSDSHHYTGVLPTAPMWGVIRPM